ncbi:MAG TPA: hypothetical protein VFH58_13620 [Acidimicrobiales bacterium]|nr:hypothetical protein [Acidimicrobiales bacterium]
MTTILTVLAMLGGISLLLWLSTFVETRHLGPVVAGEVDLTDGSSRPVMEPALGVVEAVQTAA